MLAAIVNSLVANPLHPGERQSAGPASQRDVISGRRRRRVTAPRQRGDARRSVRGHLALDDPLARFVARKSGTSIRGRVL